MGPVRVHKAKKSKTGLFFIPKPEFADGTVEEMHQFLRENHMGHGGNPLT